MTESEEPNLPGGVEFHSGPREVTVRGLPAVEIEYRMHGLGLKIGWTVSPPNYFKAPDRVEISPEEPLSEFLLGGPDIKPEMYNGVTKPLLRSIPMAHARQHLRAPYEQLSVRLVQERFLPIPIRIETDAEYMHVACAYVELVTGPSAEPIRRLNEWTGVKAPTWSARLQRARAKGILVGRGRHAHISPDFKDLERDVRARLSDGAARASDNPPPADSPNN
ncbi:hypothetical protein [Arthrobacter sp. ov118]|uniref:hypothetical protein n=1 Tax=Arthrobacter sp. ov118 TaxID=1761747 RepID=UPI0011604915|nr:hypothetical protein [Arthrobacter sp. ov118]